VVETMAGQATETSTEEPAEAPTQDGSTEDGEQPTEDGEQPAEEESSPEREAIEAAAFAVADEDGDGELSDTPATEPTSNSDPAWITEQLVYELYTHDCTDPANLVGGIQDDPDVPLVSCSQDGFSK